MWPCVWNFINRIMIKWQAYDEVIKWNHFPRYWSSSSNGNIFHVTGYWSFVGRGGGGNSPVTGECPAQRPVTRNFDVFFDLHLNNGLSKQSWGWLFETPSRPLWCHCNKLQCNYHLWKNNNVSIGDIANFGDSDIAKFWKRYRLSYQGLMSDLAALSDLIRWLFLAALLLYNYFFRFYHQFCR